MVSCCVRVDLVKDRNLKAPRRLDKYEVLTGDATMVPMNSGEQEVNPRSAMSCVTSIFFHFEQSKHVFSICPNCK